ncbi:AMP-binding protein [uncultured Pseudodesulfovibrio sp.]|uniref:AMP-binding protein n=1 Tax=uncultured Pseudodesulfovibrio sp. TaxID=2035858 RepID=UPI0029C60E99|nr:AMP-binding protein [uncultured Pseudodesulfovibrio sp.]
MSNQITTLKELLESTVSRYPDRIALSFVGGEPITYSRLNELVHDMRTLLMDCGIEPGDKVAIISENMPNWAITYFAITSMGAIAVPILQEFHTSAVNHILRHSEAKMVVASERYIHKVEAENFPGLKTVVSMNDLSIVNEDDEPPTHFKEAVETARHRLETAQKAAREKLESAPKSARDTIETAQKTVEQFSETAQKTLEQFSDAAKKLMVRKGGKRKGGKPAFELTSDSVAVILYTSGTTGHSKGVVLTHGNLVSNVLSGVLCIPVFETDRFLSVLPMAHTYESTVGLLVPMHCGSSVYYLQKPPTPKALLPAMQKVRPTVMNVVPLIIEKIYKKRIKPKLSGGGIMGGLMKIGAARRKVSRIAGAKLVEAFGGELRCMCIGGAALSPEVEKFLDDAKFPYAVGYGMTETSPLVAGTRPGKQRLRGIGPTLEGISLKIADPDPETGEGEIFVKGPNVMREYYKAPKDTEDTFTEDGWLKTGDLGLVDEDGYVFIKGRLKNVIIGPSGENIYPEEVESIINGHDYVMESMVHDAGGKLSARIHLNYEALDEALGAGKMFESEVRKKVKELLEEIRKDVNGKVSTFARLSRVTEQVEPFEKTPTQKIKRFVYLDK